MTSVPQIIDERDAALAEEPPRALGRTLLRLGPGLIIAGSIVGSGELIATTKTGAQAGMSLLWLIVIGCIIKVFIQIALGRHTVTHGETTLAAINRVPGPRWRANWVVWFWLAMMAASTAQLGGIVQGVGQSLAITAPLSGDFRDAVRLPTPDELIEFEASLLDVRVQAASGAAENPTLRARIDAKQRLLSELEDGRFGEELRTARPSARNYNRVTEVLNDPDQADVLIVGPTDRDSLLATQQRSLGHLQQLLNPYTMDDKIWAGIATLITVIMLYNGRYQLVQNITMTIVGLFTLIVLAAVVGLHLQTQRPDLQISIADWLGGFGWPQAQGDVRPLATALATFGIIGVGSAELVAYPYWCLEKGYARFTGPRTEDDGWARRARGWIRVMRIDAWLSLVVYTFATVAFYMLGATVLHRQELDPEGIRTVSTLTEQFVPMFGQTGGVVFLVGAVAVLYSTFLVANAGNARALADSVIVLKFAGEGKRRLWTTLLCVLLPLTSFAICLGGYDPVALVLFAGLMQALMLPLLGIAALWMRFKESDSRLRPSKLGDVCLMVSLGGALVAGGWLAWGQITKMAAQVGEMLAQ